MYGEDAIHFSSDSGSVFLRGVKRISVTGHGILGEVHYSVQSIMCRHSDIIATDSKGLAKEEDESRPSPACQCQTAHHSAQREAITTMGWTVLCHPPKESQFSTFFLVLEGCTQKTLLCR